jgi:5'-nucleotidase
MYYKKLKRMSLFILASLLAVSVYAAEPEYDACGHIEHDSLALRAQAATRTQWRDHKAANPETWIRFKILGFNDFHGQLQPRSVAGRPAGGAAVLASYLEAENSAAKDGAIIVHAGDQVGASPPISALLQDEPSISFLNMLANKKCRYKNKLNPKCNIAGTLGNHEFDEGVDEMLRLINGGNHPNGPFLEKNYRGAKFPYVIANVVYADTNKPILPPYVIKRIKGMPVAFIGLVLKETPTIVTPSGVAGVKFLDEAESANKYVPELKKKGVRAIVVTIHQGTNQDAYSGPTNPLVQDIGGSIGPIITELDDEIDIVVSGHWHRFTNALMENKNGKQMLVTQAFSASTAYADIDVAIDPRSRDIVEKSAEIVTTWTDEGPGLMPNKKVAAMVAEAAAAVEPLVNRVVGEAATDILRAENNAAESALGNLIADAQRAAMETDIALMNPGGIRADIAAGQLTWGELFTVQPFNNDLVKMNLTGQQIVDLLNQQWAGQPFARVMKPSGITYTWDGKNTEDFLDDEVVVSSIKIGGNAIDLGASYSLTVNNFMADGGDNFTVLTQGSNRVVGPVDLDALVDFVQALPQPFSYAIEDRLNRIN